MVEDQTEERSGSNKECLSFCGWCRDILLKSENQNIKENLLSRLIELLVFVEEGRS